MNKFYKIICDISEEERELLKYEMMLNEKLFEPIKMSFGHFKPSTTSRKIILLRSFTKEHDEQKFPFKSFVGSARWENTIEKFPVTKSFCEDLCEQMDGLEIGKVLYAKMPPGGTMNWHTDSYPLYSSFARVHVPIQTKGEGSTFFNENGMFTMKEGFAYAYNTQPCHTALNNSDEDRFHLIVDVLPKEPEFGDVYFVKETCSKENTNFFSSEVFQDKKKRLGTLLLYANTKQDGCTLLWNSLKSRAKFLEDVVWNDGVLEKIHWKDSYVFVRNDMNLGNVIVKRTDF